MKYILRRNKMKKWTTKRLLVLSAVLLTLVFGTIAYSHCQIPCGIYNDQGRFDMISEHIMTIEKSMNTINELSKQENPNMNQMIRWVENKDYHADELSHIVTYYFMAQRVKLPEKSEGEAYDTYVKKLALLHQMMVHAMHSKQTTDLVHVEKLRSLLSEFHEVYFAKAGHREHEHAQESQKKTMNTRSQL
jgi:nickel superoxide dismutase